MSGWKNMNCRLSVLVISMIILSPLLQAETQNEEEIPTIELLEFLGEWQENDGEWLDPEELEDEDFANLLRLTSEEDE
jgi:hypothetical protein